MVALAVAVVLGLELYQSAVGPTARLVSSTLCTASNQRTQADGTRHAASREESLDEVVAWAVGRP